MRGSPTSTVFGEIDMYRLSLVRSLIHARYLNITNMNLQLAYWFKNHDGVEGSQTSDVCSNVSVAVLVLVLTLGQILFRSVDLDLVVAVLVDNNGEYEVKSVQ